MNTAGDGNLTCPGISPDCNNRSYYKNNETSGANIISDPDNIEGLVKLAIPLYSLIFVLGTIGNGLVIWIAGFRKKKTIGAVWFLNLAIADFLFCASFPLRIAEWAYLYSDVVDTDFICTSNIILFNLNGSASVLLLTAMSIDRCVSVMWPFWAKSHRTRNVVIITAAIIWVTSLLLTGLVFYLYRIDFKDYYEWCIKAEYFEDFPRNIKQMIRFFRLFIMFVIPFLVILISYVIVFIKIKQSKKSQRSHRLYRIIAAVVLCFFICWLPYYIWPLMLIYDEPANDYQFHTANTIIIILACLNSCINPVIYVFMGQNLKHGFLRSIPSRLQRAFSEHPDDQCQEQEDCEHTNTVDI